MATLTPSPKMQFFDANGNPLSGGKLYTYAAGTTTPLATYTDSGAGTANANPIILDSRGEASVWLGGSLYYMELKSSIDVLIWTSDNIGGMATLPILAASGGSALIGFIQSGTGAVSRTSQNKMRDIVSVKDFGAVGDGVTDDTTAFISSAALGVPVFIPTGSYKITGSITGGKFLVYSGVTFVGGTVSGIFYSGIGAGTSTPVEGLVDSNTAIGINVLSANTTGSENTAIGCNALNHNTSGTENNAFGALALSANTTGAENVAIGVRALATNSTGTDNTAVGHAALNYNTTGTDNTATGQTALYHNTTGIGNTAVGRQALQTLTTGGFNSAFGHTALNTCLDGNYNCGFGRQSLYSATSGSLNVSVGADSLLNLTTGSSNVAIGYSTGLGVTTGSNNTIIGANVSGLAAGLTANIILADGNGGIKAKWDGTYWEHSGAFKLNTTTNRTGQANIDHDGAGRYGIAIHNTDTGAGGQYVMYFTRGAAVTNVGSIAATNTTTTYNTSSDYRLKNNITDLTGSGKFIDSLLPRMWKWNIDGSSGSGFIAHEIQEISPSSVSGLKDATDKDNNPIYQGIDASSAEIIANLVAEIKELRKRVSKLEII